MLVSSYTSDQTRRGVLDGLYASEQVVGDAVQKRIAVVQAVRDKRQDQSLSSICRQRPDNRTQLPKLKKPGTANSANLYVVCPSDELVRDGFKQVAAVSCRFNNPISRKTRLSLARVTFKPFRSTFTIGK